MRFSNGVALTAVARTARATTAATVKVRVSIFLGFGSGWEVWEWDLSEDMKLVREIAAFIAVAIAG